MTYVPKTDWKNKGEPGAVPVYAADVNRWELGIADAHTLAGAAQSTADQAASDAATASGTADQAAVQAQAAEDAVDALSTSSLAACGYGDSITANGGYQPHVTTRLRLSSYVNRGVSGRPMADGTANGAGTVTTILANSDHALFDLVTIAAGTNDFRLDVPLGTLGAWAASPLDRGTYLGAYRTALDHILSNHPQVRIVLCTPLKRNNAGYTDESTNAAGHMLSDYAQAVRDVGTMYGLPVCDWYADSGFSERTLATFTTDGLHPNTTGNARLGRFTGDYIGSVLGIAPSAPVADLVADTFERADSASSLGSAETGQAWSVQSTSGATWGITDGQAHQTAGTTGFASVDAGVLDLTVTATIGTVGGAATGGLGAWITDADNGIYIVQVPTGYQLARRSAGANTVIATLTVTPTVGDVLELVTAGTLVRAYANGALVGQHPNLTAPPRTSRIGFWGTGSTGPRFENITASA